MSGTNPFIPQGSLNRLIGSLSFPGNPSFNITPEFLGTEALSINPGGPVTTMLGTLTGAVNSPEPFMMVGILIHLVRSQPLANEYKKKIQTNSFLGEGVFRPDTTTMDPFDFTNCNVTELRPMAITGRDAGFMISISGVWYINSSLWGG